MKKLISVFILLVVTTFAFGEIQEYVLQAGDVISINVVEHAEFSGRHKIRPDGRINYPVIGEIDVASQTCAQLVKVMQGKLSSYVNNPVVSISIESYYANKIFIIGAVARAGEYQIYEPIDLIKALAMCGGLINPKVKQIKIVRTDGTIINANMTEIWGNAAKYDTKKYLLYPGDTMYVPESVTVPWAIITAILSMTSIALQIVLTVNNIGSRSK